MCGAGGRLEMRADGPVERGESSDEADGPDHQQAHEGERTVNRKESFAAPVDTIPS